jgi:hypothetical protein
VSPATQLQEREKSKLATKNLLVNGDDANPRKSVPSDPEKQE